MSLKLSLTPLEQLVRSAAARALTAALAFALGCASRSGQRPAADPRAPISCSNCEKWNAPREPFRVFGNTWFVGPAELGAVLITSPQGHVLLDGALPQSVDAIEQNVRALSFRVEEIKVLGNTHTHFDHAGGLAALQLDSGAEVVASPRSAEALLGLAPGADEPQPGSVHFPPVRAPRIVADGEVVAVGDLRLTAHLTPGHTPGGTTWTWRSCEGERCLDMVYADSLTPVSDDGFLYTAHPGLAEAFARSIDAVAALPCDILLTPHPGFIDLDEKRAAQRAGKADAFVDRNGCRDYAKAARAKLEERLARERPNPDRGRGR
jgi:metallo-beta-lactamase class B